MKPRLFIPLFLISLAANVRAQNVSEVRGIAKDTLALQIVDNAKYRIFYSLSFVEDTAFTDSKTECQTVLLVGNEYSSFLDYNSLRKDSIFNSLVKSGKDVMSVVGQTIAVGRQIKFKPVVIKNFPSKGDFTFQEMITARENYRYTDKDIKIKWQLSAGEKQIGKYKCKKATCSYRGRNYTAWYSPDLVLSEGPYVFSGLPGLILNLYDDREHYVFSLNGIEQAKGYNPVYLPSDHVVNSTRETVRQITGNLRANPASILQMMEGRAQVSEKVLKKVQPKPYNPIELK